MAAKSPETGYIGVPDKKTIPALCASCHADPERMLPYGLPIDQLREYEQSVHGQLLAQGDENVATCFDCHGGHAAQVVSDPGSSVYPTNLQATCARCHADKERMAPYGILTNQYELYQNSVHGIALLREQNLEAPTCATCHSDHGATLPGYTQVTDLCGQCHSQEEKYYIIGGHRRGRQDDSEAPRCITCHGRYDVQPASTELFVGDEPRHCGSCHASGSLERAAIDAMYQTLVRAEQAIDAAEEAMAEARAAE
jgi:predicted CXXCH cytochrome family protein